MENRQFQGLPGQASKRPRRQALAEAVADTFTLNSPEHGSGKKRSHPAYL
jgi:hypothetical protein